MCQAMRMRAALGRVVLRAPAVKVGPPYWARWQVGRTPELEVISDLEAQFLAYWKNLRLLLDAAGCTFEDVSRPTECLLVGIKCVAIQRNA